MRRVVLVACALACAGCTEALDGEFLKVRTELAAQIKQGNDSVKSDYSRDLTAMEQRLQSDYSKKLESLKRELDAQREVHQKDLKEVNVTLIDVQKDFFQNRRVTEDSARRVYIMESLIAASRAVPEEKAEGEIVFLRDGDVTTTLGAKHGIKAGAILAVFKDNSAKEKTATIRVMVAETNQSKGEIVEKSADVARGNVVKPMK
jgi:hypothetical protein